MIPGLKEKVEVREKVRIGERREARSGSTYPAAVDYFASPDAEFKQLCGDKPKSIRIRLAYPEVEDCFSSGLEWWVKTRAMKDSALACYTKGEGSPPIALRLEHYVNDTDVKRGDVVGSGRQPITCPVRDCPILKKGDCKPMARLVFFLDGGQTGAALQIDTKSWNSVERLTGSLKAARSSGPLTDRVFELSVAFETKGANRFPVLAIQEVDVQIKSAADVEKVEALIALDQALAEGLDSKVAFARALDVEVPGWRENEAVVNRIKEIGVDAAIANFRKRFD